MQPPKATVTALSVMTGVTMLLGSSEGAQAGMQTQTLLWHRLLLAPRAFRVRVWQITS
jgi:hypothetical protein